VQPAVIDVAGEVVGGCLGMDPERGRYQLGVGAVSHVDGEVIAIRGGRPDFGLLQSRMHIRRPAGRPLSAVPVQLYLFDLLQAGGELLLGLPYTARRERLTGLGLDTDPVRTCRGTEAGRPTSRPPASPTAWRAWSASRWPRPTIPASAGTGS